MNVQKAVRTFFQVLILILFSLLGEAAVRLFNLIIPGSVAGLLLLLAGLLMKVVPISLIEEGAKALLLFLPLFFIPATVGIIQYPELLSADGLLFILIALVSTILSLVSAGWSGQLLERADGPGEEDE